MTAGLALGMPRLMLGAGPRPGGPNDAVNVAVIGLGSTTAVGGVGGRGHQLIGRLRETPGVKIVALCDADQAHLDRELEAARDHGEKVAAYRDPREVFDDKGVDAVVVALPNHWHALATVWACQAGKDVYVEKPFSYDLWEGRQMVAAARKYGRMVQVGTQNRSSAFLRRVFDRLRGGELGAIRFAHALVYRARDGIGTVDAPTPPPRTADYDLWCGPAPKGPLMRKQLHYEWHWFWDTGNGEMGNNGIHVIDVCRWALGQDRTPPRAMSIGGRFGLRDCGETANTHIALLDFQPAPLICEVRNVSAGKGAAAMGKFRGQNKGVVIDCEGGYFAGDASGGAFFDRQGKKVQDLGGGRQPQGAGTGPPLRLPRRRPQPEGRRPGGRGARGASLDGLLPHGERVPPAREAILARGHPGRDHGQRRDGRRLRALPRVSARERRGPRRHPGHPRALGEPRREAGPLRRRLRRRRQWAVAARIPQAVRGARAHRGMNRPAPSGAGRSLAPRLPETSPCVVLG